MQERRSQISAFARFLGSFDSRLLQHPNPELENNIGREADIASRRRASHHHRDPVRAINDNHAGQRGPQEGQPAPRHSQGLSGPSGFRRAFRSSSGSRKKPLFSRTSDVFNRAKKRLDIKSCGPDAPTLASSLRRHVGPTGRTAPYPPTTVANKPGHRGEREGSR
jgi:hypothetical protein